MAPLQHHPVRDARRHPAHTVGIVDAQRAFADAMCVAMRSTADLDCIGVADSATAARTLVRERRPTVLIVDHRLVTSGPAPFGSMAAEERAPTRMLLLTGFASSDLWARVSDTGFHGMASKTEPLLDVLDAVRAVARGERAHTIDLRDTGVTLSDRQREVLDLMGRGLDPATIADELDVSIHTARGHVKNVMKLMGASTQLEAVTTALRTGFLTVPTP